MSDGISIAHYGGGCGGFVGRDGILIRGRERRRRGSVYLLSDSRNEGRGRQCGGRMSDGGNERQWRRCGRRSGWGMRKQERKGRGCRRRVH